MIAPFKLTNYNNIYVKLSRENNLIQYSKSNKKSLYDYNKLVFFDKLIPFEFENLLTYEKSDSIEMNKIRNYFNLDKMISKDNEITTLVNLNKWAFEYFHYNGKNINARIYDDLSIFEIIKRSKKDGNSLNCRYISVIFTQCLLSIGYKSRLVVCKSSNINDVDCHCVTEVWVEKYKKWIILDSAFGLIYYGKNGIPLNCFEIRENLILGEKIMILSKFKDQILLYLIKNTFRFFISLNNNHFLNSSTKKMIYIHPVGFNIKEKDTGIEIQNK